MADELKTERIQLMMTPSEVKAIDDWSFEYRIRGRAEAMRRLIEIGLKTLDPQPKASLTADSIRAAKSSP